MERVTRIELASRPWEGHVLPLNYTRCCKSASAHIIEQRQISPPIQGRPTGCKGLGDNGGNPACSAGKTVRWDKFNAMKTANWLHLHPVLVGALLLCGCDFTLPLNYFQLPPGMKTAYGYDADVLVRGQPLAGLHGLTVDSDGRLLAGSVISGSIYEISRLQEFSGWDIFQPPPQGMADDLEQGPDGTLAWTAYLQGRVYSLAAEEKLPKVIAEGLPGVNSLAFDAKGRLFVSRVFLADELYEMDPTGQNEPRLVASDLGGLNGFDFGSDGHIYGPLWFRNKIIRLNPDNLHMTDIATGLGIPAAVNFDSEGTLWAVDTQRGQLLSMEPTATPGMFAPPQVQLQLAPALDNLAIGPEDEVYVSNMADNSVIRYDPVTGNSQALLHSPLAVVGDLAADPRPESELLYIADLFALRQVEISTGRVSTLARVFSEPAVHHTEAGVERGTQSIDYPMHLGISDDGSTLVLTSWTAGKIQLFDRSQNKVVLTRSGVETPHDATFLQDGRIAWLEYAPGNLVVSGPELDNPRVITSGLAGPASLVASGDMVYITESLSGQVVRINLKSGDRTVLFRDLDRPEGLALDSDGDLLIAEAGADRLIRLDPNTRSLRVLARDIGLEQQYVQPGLPSTYIPVGVTVTADGAIFIGSNRWASVYELRR